MSRKRLAVPPETARAKKKARLSLEVEEPDEATFASESEDNSSSAEDSDASSDIDEDADRPSFAVYAGESELEDFDGGSEEEESSGEDLVCSVLSSAHALLIEKQDNLQNELAGLPMGALLKAQRRLSQSVKKQAPAPLPVDEEPVKKGRQRAPKSGRTTPRFANAATDTPLPSFLTGPNAARPGVKKEKREKKELHGREGRHAPAVMSSKRAVGRARQVVEGGKVTRRDPRFDAISGGFDQHKFDKAYSFLDEHRTAELADLRKQVKAKSAASMTPDEREKQKKALMRLESQLEAKKRSERERAVLSAHRREEKARRADGKAPYHLKRADEKALLAKAREEQLAKEGKLQKSIRRKEMKASQKEKKRRPEMRRLVS